MAHAAESEHRDGVAGTDRELVDRPIRRNTGAEQRAASTRSRFSGTWYVCAA
jgi:hypothetical protein